MNIILGVCASDPIYQMINLVAAPVREKLAGTQEADGTSLEVVLVDRAV